MHNTYSEITNNKANNDDDPAFEASFCARYQARPATQENLSAVTVLDLLQKRTVQFCGRFNPVTGASAPPPSCFLFANRALSSRSRPDDVLRPPEACRRPRLASRQRHPGPLPCPLRRVGPVSTTTAQVVLRGQGAFHHTRLR